MIVLLFNFEVILSGINNSAGFSSICKSGTVSAYLMGILFISFKRFNLKLTSRNFLMLGL